MKKLLLIALLFCGCGIFEKEEEEISINVEWLTVSQFEIMTGCSYNTTDDDGLALERLYTFYTNDSNFPSFQTEYDK
jgi:hypothetical protein